VLVCPSDSAEPVCFVWTPTDTGAATGSYAFCAGDTSPTNSAPAPFLSSTLAKYSNRGMFFYLRRLKLKECTDGLSHTIFEGEVVDGHVLPSTNRWSAATRSQDCSRTTYNPPNTFPGEPVALEDGDGNQINGAFASRHPSGCNFLLGDGSVHFINESIDINIYQALGTRTQGESIGTF
jgi:prepilin-type processing-associated H-X9-DG protein